MVEIRRRPLPRHGTDHDSEPLRSFPRLCLPARPLQCRQEEYRSGRASAQGFGRSLLALPFAGSAQLNNWLAHFRSSLISTRGRKTECDIAGQVTFVAAVIRRPALA